MTRSTIQDYNYYGSDLNKFIDEKCSRELTAINIDLLLFKRSKRSLRIVECKHGRESMPSSQLEVLRIFSKLIPPRFYKFEIFIVRGDEPYDFVRVEDVSNGRKYNILSQENFIDWLEFLVEIEDIGQEV